MISPRPSRAFQNKSYETTDGYFVYRYGLSTSWWYGSVRYDWVRHVGD